MDRLRISSAVPAEIAERISDVAGEEFSAEDLRDAREDLTEKLLDGWKVAGTDLEAVIDRELNDNYGAFVRGLYEHFAGIGNKVRSEEYDRNMRAEAWMRRLVERYLDANVEAVEERAAEIAAERLEDCE